MLYQTYQAYADMTDPFRSLAKAAIPVLARHEPELADGDPIRKLAAAYEVFSRLGFTHSRPPFGIDSVTVAGKPVAVTEEAVFSAPFGTLLRFKKDIAAVQPRVLLVAPMSGHFATLLRGTVRTLLLDHDVYITDWHNARDVSLVHGRFGLDDYVNYLIRFLEVLGAGAHIIAICQPSVAALAAVALMAAENHPAPARTMTLMAGPIDTRINPTEVNVLATSRPIDWFEKNLIAYVPLRHGGALRRVYPGFLQIASFMSMNLDRHAKAFLDLYHHQVNGEHEKANAIRVFYEEYFALMDLPAEFYLETVQSVFQEYDLPLGRMKVGSRLIDPAAIRRTALLTVEGEKDDICAIGQTLAAQELCTSIPPFMRRHHVQTGVGHYGVFNGRRWENHIYPIVRDFIHVND